ncbi:anaphase-promoting complex, subunit 15 mnd2 [Trichoderma arundinaceum]|uniref:Anaphase-promoting complex, subunit 15 mnd2 n=1 Tax=Trichoderma arundinaceum TaxID=490622 RepID=A0A395NJJ2_TRIAR|nr:anaphase-promoting complex, subunit 15 mnd2 [Trichoderma arundinaceum]
MFATLPDFTPRDSHSLWYSSSRNPFIPPGPVDNLHADPNSSHHGPAHSRQRGQLMERTLLARLAADEQKMHRRRMNVQNFGSTWLKPPGVPKTLHQMREEKREQEEHQEAMRREQLAQELAEAEGGGAMDDGMMDDVQLDGAQDLDDEIPDADDGFDSSSDDSEEDEDEEDEEDENDQDEDDEEEAVREEEADEEALREERQHDLVATRMRMTDDAFREALIRGDPEADGSMYGGEEELEDEDRGQILDEDDFAYDGNLDDGTAGDMDADLDDDIPEAEDDGYEHTDSEAGVSSSAQSEEQEDEEDKDEDEDDEEEGEGDTTDTHDLGFAPSRTAPLGTPQSPTLPRHAGFHTGPRASMDLSGLLSQDESSLMMMESSPAVMRRRPGQRK